MAEGGAAGTCALCGGKAATNLADCCCCLLLCRRYSELPAEPSHFCEQLSSVDEQTVTVVNYLVQAMYEFVPLAAAVVAEGTAAGPGSGARGP